MIASVLSTTRPTPWRRARSSMAAWTTRPPPGSPVLAITLRDHRLQVFAREHQRAVVGSVAQLEEIDELARQRGLSVAVEESEDVVQRATVGSEHLDPMERRP